MDDLQFEDLDFPLGWCAQCGREVLMALRPGDEGRECVHCGEPISGRIRQIGRAHV